jgi:hypothetical protein
MRNYITVDNHIVPVVNCTRQRCKKYKVPVNPLERRDGLMPNRKLRVYLDLIGLIIVVMSVWMSSGLAGTLEVVSGILAFLALVNDANLKF